MIQFPILLVDDEEGIRTVLSISLMDSGYPVDAAGDVDSALELFKAKRHPLVVTDIKMPGKSGIDLLREVKEIAPETEVIMITGHGDMELAVQSLKNDAFDFIAKPINDDVLGFALERATERIRMRRELEAYAQNKHEQLFDQSPCYISVQDSDLKVRSINARYKDDFGDHQGRKCYEELMHRRHPCQDCPLQKTFEDGKTHQLETVITNRKGEKVNVLIWSSPIRNAAGEIVEAIEMITDITQIRKLQDRLTTLGLLLGSTAHGIKGMLTGIDGAMYRVGSGLEKKNLERVEDGYNDLQFLTDRVKQTVLDILYYTKKRELNWKEMDVARFTMDLYASFAGKAKVKDVIIDLDMMAVPGTFKVDGSILASALGNMLENAIDACSSNDSGERRVTLKVYSDKGQVAFRIEDNGVGMDRETREKLFTLFFSSKGSSGTGIGLFVANEIVHQHGGSIQVDSEPGKGSTFTVCIPRELSVGM
ncbi:response regulator [Pseudodesulfovibrio sp.]|nr:response regulator [Pseudodesulfovibrio sp.]